VVDFLRIPRLRYEANSEVPKVGSIGELSGGCCCGDSGLVGGLGVVTPSCSGRLRDGGGFGVVVAILLVADVCR